MKLRSSLLASATSVAFGLAVAGCASAQKPEATATSSAALTSADSNGPTAAERWAEKKVAAEAATMKAAPRDSFDPLGMGGDLEESSVPQIEITAAGQVRAKTPAEINAAVAAVKAASSVEDAAKRLSARLGKPSWTESMKGAEGSKRRIWVALSGAQCQRLVLEADGSVEVESAMRSDWRMLAASARQNPCTGELKRGLTNK